MSSPSESAIQGLPLHLVGVHVDLASKRILHAVLDERREGIHVARKNDLEDRLELGRGL